MDALGSKQNASQFLTFLYVQTLLTIIYVHSANYRKNVEFVEYYRISWKETGDALKSLLIWPYFAVKDAACV